MNNGEEHVRVFRYVPHAQIEAYLQQGWVIASTLGPPHAHYSTLMELPPWPQKTAKPEAADPPLEGDL